jgi:SAM-dependent methyltransferase
MKPKFKPGQKDIYEKVFDGLSYYQFPGEAYHLVRSKQKVQRYYLEAIKNVKSPKVLDIGCYIGTDLFMLPKVNPSAKYFGVDISQDAIKHAKMLAKKRGEENMFFQSIDANKPLPFPDQYFDVILSLELIEHLYKPEVFLTEISRLLKPGGSVILSTPNEGRLIDKIVASLPPPFKNKYFAARETGFTRHGPNFHLDSGTWDHEAHISLHSYADWVKIFNKAGFTVNKVDGSSIFGGNPAIGNHPSLLGLTILADSFIDKLPIKPYLQMCLIVKLSKDNVS